MRMTKGVFAVLANSSPQGKPSGFDGAVSRCSHALRELNGHEPERFASGGRYLLGSVTAPGEFGAPSMIIGDGRDLSVRVDISEGLATVGTDDVGLSQLCWGAKAGIVVISNSALAVAAGIGAALSPSAVATLSLTGFLFGGRTLFEGVRRLQGGESVVHRPGEMPRVVVSDVESSFGGSVHEGGADILSEVVRRLHDAHPGALLELSGGLDSRAVLAAIPAASRSGRLAVTLGNPGQPDVVIAEELARRCGLEWMLIDQTDLRDLTPEDLRRRIDESSRRRDCMFNALAAVLLDDADAKIPAGPRFTGANGEFARGFYYPGVITDGRVTRRRTAQLARWRLFTNDGTAATALVPNIVADARHDTVEILHAELAHQMSWRVAVDEFYLRGRMANWAGPSYSARRPASPALGPFFHPSFLNWARALPRRSVERERRFAQLVTDLDPLLADVPLDRGPTVASLTAGGPYDNFRRALTVGRKVVRKFDQRVRKLARPPNLSDDLIELTRWAWRSSDSAALEEVGLFGSDFLRKLEEGVPIDGPALSLALNVASATTFLAAVANSSHETELANDREL